MQPDKRKDKESAHATPLDPNDSMDSIGPMDDAHDDTPNLAPPIPATPLHLGEWSKTPVGGIYDLKLVDSNKRPLLDKMGKQVVFQMKRREDGALVSIVPDWKHTVKAGGDNLHHIMLAAMGPKGREARVRMIDCKRFAHTKSVASIFGPRKDAASSSPNTPSPSLPSSASAAASSFAAMSSSPVSFSCAAAFESLDVSSTPSVRAPTAASSSFSPAAAETVTGGPSGAPRKRSVDPIQGTKLCEGYVVPGLLRPVAKNYPHHLHATAMNWSHPNEDGRIYSTSPMCVGVVVVEDMNIDGSGSLATVCTYCRQLEANDKLKAVVERASNETLHRTRIKSVYLTYSQLCRRSEMHKANSDLMRVKLYHSNERVKRLDAKLDLHKQLLTKLTENDVVGLRLLLVRWHQGGASVKIILRQVQLCIEHRYKPRNKPTDVELDKAQHALILGGSRMLYGLQKTCGFLSRSTVHTHRPSNRFITSWNNIMCAAHSYLLKSTASD